MAQLKSTSVRVVCMVPSTSIGLFIFRVEGPLTNWARRYGGEVRFRLIGEHEPNDLLWGDVFLFERLVGAYTLNLIKVLKAHGKRVVFEIDDLLTEVPDFLAHHRTNPEAQRSLVEAIALSDMVTTTTSRLASRLEKINPKVVCVPNCINELPPERMAHQNGNQPLATLIVASTDTVLVDWLIQPLKQIQQKYGEKIKVLVVGPINRALEKGGIHFEGLPILSYPDFTSLLQTLINPIGLIPLDDSTFSSCKSPIKFFDYAVACIPTICSNVPPYSDYVENNFSGLLVDNRTDAWIDAIERLILSIDDRKKLANNARQFVIATHLVDRAGDAWQTVINKIYVGRVETPGLVEASLVPVKLHLNAKWICKKLLERYTYQRLFTILKTEGIGGVKKRLARW